MSNPETVASNQIRLDVGKARRHVRLFRNARVFAWIGEVVRHVAREITLRNCVQVQTGLVNGAGDLVGWTSVIVTPDMVGKRVAIFTAPDVKVGKNQLSDPQIIWRANVIAAGGIAGAVYTSDDLLKLIDAAPGRPAV